LVGSLFSHGFHDDLVIVSDDAPQFALLLNALCWIHAERHFRKFIPVSDQVRLEVKKIRDAIWNLYRDLKVYKAKTEDLRKYTQYCRETSQRYVYKPEEDMSQAGSFFLEIPAR
jgi:hypothetical protein